MHLSVCACVRVCWVRAYVCERVCCRVTLPFLTPKLSSLMQDKLKQLDNRFNNTLKNNWGLETLVSVGESWMPAMLEQVGVWFWGGWVGSVKVQLWLVEMQMDVQYVGEWSGVGDGAGKKRCMVCEGMGGVGLKVQVWVRVWVGVGGGVG